MVHVRVTNSCRGWLTPISFSPPPPCVWRVAMASVVIPKKGRFQTMPRLSLSHCLRRQPAAIRKPALKKCRRPKDTLHALGQGVDFLGPCRARQELHRSATTADNPHASVLFGESGFERVSSVLCWLGLMSHGGPWEEFFPGWRVAACIKGSGDAHLESDSRCIVSGI